jgi:glycosyltransferase involved in cell wall biosynthesis
MPLVSIGLAVYNGEQYIRQAIESLLAQDYANYELIISDNASNDRTGEICLEYRDSRIKYYRNPYNLGAIANFNRVFELSSGEYFMWASHDDYRNTTYISKCLESFGKSDKIVLVGTECDCVDAKDNLVLIDRSLSTIGLSIFQRFIKYKSILHAPSKHRGGIFYGLFKRSALQKVMPLKHIMASDHILMLKLSLLGEYYTINERLLVKRTGGASDRLKTLARTHNITNPLLINGVYFIREYEIFKMLIASNLNLVQKLLLIAWSPLHTFVMVSLRIVSLYLRVKP